MFERRSYTLCDDENVQTQKKVTPCHAIWMNNMVFFFKEGV